jgi:hypothetical protein
VVDNALHGRQQNTWVICRWHSGEVYAVL